MRFVKMEGHEPGVRRDLVTGEDVYSSRFLNAEEHMNDWWVFEIWATIYCWCASISGWCREELRIRWRGMNVLETFLIMLGLMMTVLLIWAFVGFWMP